MSGKLTPLTMVEEETFAPHELAEGWRLACQAEPLSDVKLHIPPESLSAIQRLQVEGLENHIPLNPQVTAVEVRLPPPSLTDLRDDLLRLSDTFAANGLKKPRLALPVLFQFSERMRQQDWTGRLAIRQDGEVVGTLLPDQSIYGLAVDIGTTKIAAYLVNLDLGKTAAKRGAMNPQISFGEDVVSRIGYANQGDAERLTLQTCLVETLNELLSSLCEEIKIDVYQVVDAVIVCNTAMHHLFAGISVRQLWQAPYVAAVTAPLDFPAAQVGLVMAPGAHVYLPPNIAGYVGADHVSMVLATQTWQKPGVTLALDIGTNTEISLSANGRLVSCSCASGPAFEGAHISAGMRAVPGAIERVQCLEGKLRIFTIDHEPPVGICGSGVLDAVAEMRSSSIIDERGTLRKDAPGVRPNGRTSEFLLVPAGSTGTGKDITITRRDVNEIQLAKAAIRTGIEILLAELGLQAQEIDEFIVAGAFGTYLYLPSAVRIGMFPNLPAECFSQVGNAAGIGARQMLISMTKRDEALEILQRMEYIELTTHPEFQDTYVRTMVVDPI
jgi:uncharacterized 2Fe-2S/4Fe-4S cluster protein (DUF4445 family)